MSRKQKIKAMRNKAYRAFKAAKLEKARRIKEEARRIKAEEKAEFYEKRFRDFGSNVKTLDTKGILVTEKWECKYDIYGKYAQVDENVFYDSETMKKIEYELAREIAKSLIDLNLIQFIRKEKGLDPFSRYGTVGAKLYVVPWDRVPHERTIEFRRYVEKGRINLGDSDVSI